MEGIISGTWFICKVSGVGVLFCFGSDFLYIYQSIMTATSNVYAFCSTAS